MDLIRALLWPVSRIYEAVVLLRNFCYDRGWFSAEKFEVPVLSIGNLSVGGTGKTPMVEWVLRRFPERKIAVLSRGYRRKSKGFLLAGPGMTAADLGDEPFQIARKFPGVPIAVGADRRHGIRQLRERVDPELIVLDDGFQHRRVQPAGSILLTAWESLYPDQEYLPAGDLRDHKNQAKRADVIAVTKCPELPGPEARGRILQKLKPRPGQQVVFATLEYASVVDDDGSVVPLEELRREPVTLVTGIARPAPLAEHLQGLGISFEHLAYADHHHFKKREIDALHSRSRILTTEKDAARLGGALPGCWVIGVAHRFGPGDEEVLKRFVESL